MADGFNYARAETNKIGDADRFVVRLEGRYEDGRDIDVTRGMGLTKEQYDQVKALLISFNL